MLSNPNRRVLTKNKINHNRRSAVIVWTVASSAVILGFSALAVDVGYTYHVKAQLQRTADAAAMAAASQMGGTTDPSHADALRLAQEYAAKNKIGDKTPLISESDVVMGRAVPDGDKWEFVEGATPYDSVKVSVKLTKGSPNGAVPLFFGSALGQPDVELAASAIAMLVPRDIAIVVDLSRSMNYDSQLRHEPTTTINIQKVWQDLGSRTYGTMSVFTSSKTGMTYNSGSSASTMVTTLHLNTVTYPYSTGSWTEYCNYVRGTSPSGAPTIPDGSSGQPNYKYYYGLRTFINYLLACKTPNLSALANTQAQPTYALKQAVEELDNYLLLMDSGDHVSLHSYADSALKLQSLTGDYTLITQKVYQQWAGGTVGTNTNISVGIENAITELTSGNARKNAKKVIFLMTDGEANLPSNATVGKQTAITSAQKAISKDIQIYTIGLGSEADQETMATIASIGKGVFYYVPTLNISQYSEDLKRVFRTLGGKRPVHLIQ